MLGLLDIMNASPVPSVMALIVMVFFTIPILPVFSLVSIVLLKTFGKLKLRHAEIVTFLDLLLIPIALYITLYLIYSFAALTYVVDPYDLDEIFFIRLLIIKSINAAELGRVLGIVSATYLFFVFVGKMKISLYKKLTHSKWPYSIGYKELALASLLSLIMAFLLMEYTLDLLNVILMY